MYCLITNNALCQKKYNNNRYHTQLQVDYLEQGVFRDVLLCVRRRIQSGWSLQTHPLTGSLKPNQTPYKSVLVSDEAPPREDFYTQEVLIEDAIAVCEKFLAMRRMPAWSQKLREDFMAVDLSLVEPVLRRLLGEP